MLNRSAMPFGRAGGEHREADGEQDRRDEGVEQQLGGDRQPLAQDRAHVLPAGQRGAQVAVEQPAEPVPVADPEGLVQVQLDLQLVHLRGGRVGAEELLGRVAGQQVHHHEGQERHAPQHRDRGQQPPARQPGAGQPATRRVRDAPGLSSSATAMGCLSRLRSALRHVLPQDRRGDDHGGQRLGDAGSGHALDGHVGRGEAEVERPVELLRDVGRGLVVQRAALAQSGPSPRPG